MKNYTPFHQHHTSELIRLRNTFQVSVMKKNMQRILLSSFMLAMFLSGSSSTADASACGKGRGEPPFLSYGVDTNLLLLFDNSGSMLDMAYIDEIGRCTDNTFDPADQTYTGLYNPDRWYKWTEGVPQWKSGETYKTGDIVYSEGIFYQAFDADEGITSVGYQIADDSVDWAPLYETPRWTQGETYSPKSFVRYEDQLYYTVSGGTASDSDASDGISIGGDTGVEWIAVDSTWMGSESYDAGDIVTFDGMLFKALTAVPAGTSVWDDTWERLNEGYFFETDYEDVMDAASDLASAEGIAYQQDNMYLRIVNATDTSPYGTGELVPSRVTAFAASGKLLNWLASSKFDIQKKILTGGKYNPYTEHLVSQHRGCSARGFIKEIPVKQGAADAVITFSVKGSSTEDWIDTTDDTTRIAVLGVSASGFIGSDREQACQDAIDSIAGGWEDNQGTTKQNITTCLNYGGTNNILAESNAAYNHSVHSCWEMVTKEYERPSDFGQVSEVQNSCEHIYRHTFSATAITPENSGYLCYGIYNSTIPDARQLAEVAGAGSDREGYVGRCWKRGDISEGCQTVSCTYPSDDYQGENNSNIWYRCLPDNLLYSCNDYNKGQKECKQPAWTIVLRDADDTDEFTCDTTATDIGGWSEVPGPNDIQGCIQSALWDYCQGLSIPEVIDPSDQVSATEVTWGMIGALIDSGIASMFGSDHALIVMKGYIKPNQEAPREGILHTVPDLRIGAMAFNAVGAKTECEDVDPTAPIQKYCPENNKDGSRVIAKIRLGNLATDADRTHLDDLVSAINDIRATSWTPLAEAMYTAIGYYTQNREVRLHDTDFQTDYDVLSTPWQTGQEYPPGTYLASGNILYYTAQGGVSGGGSLQTDTGIDWIDVAEIVNWQPGHTYEEKSVVISDNKLYITYSGGTSSAKPGLAERGLTGGPLYDEGVLWEPLIDPVANWCQDNHVLVITEGASTADISQDIIDFATGYHDFNSEEIVDPADSDSDQQCTDGLDGSTYFDDMVYFARNRQDPSDDFSPPPFTLYPLYNDTIPSGDWPYSPMAKKSLTTSIVVAGSLRDEGTNDECNPFTLMTSAAENSGTTLMRGESPDELEEQLITFFNDLRRRASAGSAASVISSARGGEGAIYQAIFWPELRREDSAGEAASITWVGDVHGLFLDNQGRMFEDTNGNRTLDPSVTDGDGGDRRVVVYYDDDQNRAMACLAPDEDGICSAVVEITEVKYLWSANEWLSDILDQDIAVNRTNYISNENRRHVFTWNDLNNNGMVDDGEIINLETSVDWDTLSVSGGRGPVVSDFGLNSDVEVDLVISWLRGNDTMDDSMRSRQIPDQHGSSNYITWRLGDIIHSTPMAVSNPAEGYHLIYNDFSYAQFLRKYRGRRHMVYFGANDGLLHAVNAGFYSDTENKFCLVPLTNGVCDESSLPVTGAPELGAEMWAYLPYNLQPHVKCLADPDYVHKYFVDQRPRIFDAQIFEEESACRTTDVEGNQVLHFDSPDCVHPNGWGTILVGGMRFGGAPVTAYDLNNTASDNREFISSYFILDITNPEEPPELLGELTQTLTADAEGLPDPDAPEYADLGYSTVIPTMIIMKDGTESPPVNDWYLLLGSGPKDHYADLGTLEEKGIKGISVDTAKVSVLPLEWLTTNKNPLRIPGTEPTDGGLTFTLADSPNGFVSDMITVDFDINPSYREYKADAAYFGTVQGNFVESDEGTGMRWDGGGIMYRLVTKKMDASDSSSFGVGVDEDVTYPSDWKIKPLIDLTGEDQPITAAASVGTDNYNFWIYFGTGRFFDADDKTDRTQQAYYGIKEPIKKVDGKRYFTWEEVVLPASPASDAGDGTRGLWRVDQIEVGLLENSFVGSGVLTCRGGGTSCLPDYLVNNPCPVPNPDDTENEPAPCLKALEQYISGNDYNENVNCDDGINCVDGWYKKFYPYENRERNVGQATLLGGLVTFTTYQPFNDVCMAEGNAYLYGVYYRTGTAWHQNVFGSRGVRDGYVVDKLSLGRGLATTPNLHVGSGSGSGGPKAFVQTSTGEIIEIEQDNLPIKNYITGPSRWKEYNR